MTDAAAVVESRRLEELERVTRSYARYANLSGLPLSAVALWSLAGVLAIPGAASRALLLTAPVVWAMAAAISPRLYLRRGVVSATSRAVRRGSLVFCYVVVPPLVIHLAEATWYRQALPAAAAVAVACVSVIAVMAVAHQASRAAADVGLLAGVFIIAIHGADQVQSLGIVRFVWAVVWTGAALVGVLAHLRFRTLEREMAALGVGGSGLR